MKVIGHLTKGAVLLAAGAVLVVLAGCERPPMDSEQQGYRGLGLVATTNPRIEAEKAAANVAPAVSPQLPAAGPKASDVYQNVQILGDLSVGQFTRLMASITEWVAPDQGCAYCHDTQNMASDEVYTKNVSRAMLQMTQSANANFKGHMGDTGATCYTCHRGQPVPAEVWTTDPGPPHVRGIEPAGQNIASARVGYSSLPYDPLTPFLTPQENDIRVISNTALPAGSRKSIKQAEWTYSLMMHFSDSLGVGCTHCHNSRSFFAWDQSPPTRLQAWHAIRQVREMNGYINGVADILPETRKGPLGDPLKVSCKTCHQGINRPLQGAQMASAYPSLLGTESSAGGESAAQGQN